MSGKSESGREADNGLMAVVVAVNRKYVQHVCAAVKSLLANNPGGAFRIYVINSGIPPAVFDRLRRVVAGGKGCEVVDLVVPEQLFDGLVLTHYYSREIYYRLLIPELVDEERVLYLDSDIIVNGPVGALFELDLGDALAGAVREPWFDRHAELGIDASHRYFNSGVMLIDVRKWKEEGLHLKVIDYIGRNREVIRFPDQDALNAVLGERYLPLPLKYNLTFIPGEGQTPDDGLFEAGELEDARNRPVIIHYSGGSKPWQLGNRHPYKELYWKYLRMTPYRYSLPEELSPKTLVSSRVIAPLRSCMKSLVGAGRA